MTEATPDPLAKMREPFPAHQISKLPKPTKAQTDAVKADFKKGIRCQVCGSWHHPDVVHLDYVGHAALTDRLLDVDPMWSWEPMAFRDGLPAFDSTGGLWIKLTICGVTRNGYGHAAAKPGIDPGAREKEVIGDALRNAAMRFGAALDLWHKGDLHADEPGKEAEKPKADSTRAKPRPEPEVSAKAAQPTTLEGWADKLEQSLLDARGDQAKVKRTFESAAKLCADLDDKLPERLSEITATYNRLMDEQTPALAIGDDEIPY